MQLNHELAGLPHIDQYVGVWGLWEPQLKALVTRAAQVNVQLHLQQASTPEARAEIEARGDTEYEVTRDGVAIVPLHGSLMKHASSFSANTSTVAARRQIRAAARDEMVAGILLHIDSPGGTVAGTHDLAADIREVAKSKPVYAYCEDLCASAAYWLACQASRVYANESAVIGSIGVFSVLYDFSKAAESDGVKVHVVKFGAMKGAGVAGTEVTDEQLAEFQKLVNAYGEDFVNTVAAGRKISRAVAEQLADGRVHKGQAAVDLKLIDGVRSLQQAVDELVSESGKRKAESGRSRAETNPAEAATAADGITTAADAAQTPEEPSMSTETKPAAATLAELKENLPGASSDFVLAQLEKGATLTAAMKEHGAQMAKERDDANKKAEEAEKKAAAAKPGGNQPLKDRADAGEERETISGSAVELKAQFDEKVQALIKAGHSGVKATQLAIRQNADLHRAYLAAVNPGATYPADAA